MSLAALTDVLSRYDAATGAVSNTRSDTNNFGYYLKIWLEFIHNEQPFDNLVDRLSGSDFVVDWRNNWRDMQARGEEEADPEWPKNPSDRMSLQLSLLTEFYKDSGPLKRFASLFLRANEFTAIRRVITHVFEPLARDLREAVSHTPEPTAPIMSSIDTSTQPTASTAITTATTYDDLAGADLVPAADRMVTIGHNNPEYIDVVAGVDALISAVAGSNELRADDRDRLSAELRAGRELLNLVRVPLGLLRRTLETPVKWILASAMGGIVGNQAYALLPTLSQFLSSLF